MTQPPIPDILPLTASVHASCRLAIAGCDLRELIEEFGSPLYVYDELTIRSICREFMAHFTRMYPNSSIEYSSKAFSNPAILQIIEKEGLHLDVVTGGELAVASAARFPMDRVNFHGNNKSRAELVEAVKSGIGRVTIDSFHEISLLNEVAAEAGIVQSALLRLSPSIDPHTHRLTSTGILDSKFGFSIETGAAEDAVQQTMAACNIDLAGLHFHLGSPLFELEPYAEAIDYVCAFAARMRDRHGLEMREFSPGGGMAIGYMRSQPSPLISQYARTIAQSLITACDDHGFDLPKLTVEPGRAIVGRAGVALYTVGGIKRIPGVRTYVSVDGGMGDNIRPALYDSQYEVISVDNPLDEACEKVTIAGKFCESGDLLARDAELPELNPGNIVALPSAGAYCVPMASNYNMQTRPAIVLLSVEGIPRLIRRRESYADLLSTAVFE